MFKVVVSDLDGTLLNKQHQISPVPGIPCTAW